MKDGTLGFLDEQRQTIDQSLKSDLAGLTTFAYEGIRDGIKEEIQNAADRAKEKAREKAKQAALKEANDLMAGTAGVHGLDWEMEMRRNEGLTEIGLDYLQPYSDSPLKAVKNANDAFHGKVTINGKKYGIVECQYEFTQNCDPDTGKPTGRVKGGRITFTMPATSDDDHFFYQWMFDKTKTYSGTFSFVVWARQNKRVFKNFTFLDAYCVGLRDYFNDNDSKLMYTTITIQANSIFMGNDGASVNVACFDNEWSGKKVSEGYPKPKS